MFKALPNTPYTGLRLPVELLCSQPDRQFVSPFISGIQFGDQSNGPGRQGDADCGHVPSILPFTKAILCLFGNVALTRGTGNSAAFAVRS